MGYRIGSFETQRNRMIAQGVALFLAYFFNYLFQFIATCCVNRQPKQKNIVLERLLENSRVMYWFGIATMFSVYPPFYVGLHSVFLSWITLLFVFFMHVFAMVRRCDQQRSVWAYFYYFYHFSVGVWILTALVVGFMRAQGESVPADSNEE